MKNGRQKYIFLIIVTLIQIFTGQLFSQSADTSISPKYIIKLLDKEINSRYNDFAALYIKNGNILLFTSDRAVSGFNRQNILYSFLKDSVWSNPKIIDPPLNSNFNEGAITLSFSTGIMYFARQINHNTDIYQARFYLSDSGIIVTSEPEKCNNINSSYWDSEPSISADGKTLYFASTRPNGFGGSDIWVSYLDKNDKWNDPINIGEKINTAGNEYAPFIYPDSKSLFFSSDGHSGLGKLDIFLSIYDESGWNEPMNLEYLNSKENELFFSAEDSTNIFFSSDKLKGDFDIYNATLQKEVLPEAQKPQAKIRLELFGKTDDQIIGNTSLIVTDKNNNIISSPDIILNKNQYIIRIDCNKMYSIEIKGDDILNHKENIYTDSCAYEYNRKIFLYPKEWTFLLNIPFEDTVTTLNVYAYESLDSAYNILQENLDVIGEIAVHTDSSVNWSKSVRLTWQRAESIKNYLVSRGISSDRIKSKGYGHLEPIAPNTNVEGRKQNRRAELRLRKK